MKLYRYKHSRIHPIAGLWYCAPGGGIALREGPRRVSGAFINTRRGLVGVTWR